MDSYNHTLDYLYNLKNSGMKLGLERTYALCELMGNAHESYPTVLVAGTNGKGSVSAILASILREAGFKVGLYTSPHLVEFNERISVDGVNITDFELVELTEKIRALIKGRDGEPGLPFELHPTFFEFTTALAFSFFKERRVDIAILEVGMGGRLDSTNVVSPRLSVITSIALDHVSSLGTTIAEVAAEKGGIIKKNAITICGILPPDAKGVIKRIAKELGASLLMAGRDFSVVDAPGGEFDYEDSDGKMTGLTIALYGAHQRENAALAIKAFRSLKEFGFKGTPTELKRGLRNVSWPGRCELIRENPKVLLDCAHNESAAMALDEALGGFTYNRLIFVLGIMSDKDIEAILTILAKRADYMILTSPDVERASKPESLLAILQALTEKEGLSVKPRVAGSVKEAVRIALEIAERDDLICISGSVFTVGEAMSSFEQL